MIPSIDTVFEKLLNCGKQSLFPSPISREFKFYKTDEFLGLMIFNKGGTGSSSRDGKSVSCWLCACVFISRLDEGDDEGLNSFEQLRSISTMSRDKIQLKYIA